MRLCLCLVAFACTRADDTRKPDPPVPVPVPEPIPAKPAEDVGRVLLVHDLEKTPRYLAITLPDDPKATPTFAELGPRPSAIASFHKRWVHVGEKQADDRVVVAIPSSVSGGKNAYEVVVPGPATAVRIVHDALFVGMAGSFGWIDLAAPKPTYVELVKRASAFKPYDRFTREGDRLLAIDDEVMPMYADWYSLDAAGKPVKRLADWTLPSVINGHYTQAVLLPSGKNDFTLFLVAWYGVLSGNGQVLISVPIKNDQLEFDRAITLPNRDGKLAALVEHEARGGANRKDELLAGTKMSLWMDLAIARRANKVLLAAGERGLMTVPANFKPRLRTADTIDLGGSVWAVRAHGDRLFALVIAGGTSGGELVELDPVSLKPTARHALPAPYHQFVD